MANVEWTPQAWAAHEAYALGLYIEFGFETMQDYLRLIDEAVEFIKSHPLAGSPTISQAPNRRVKVTLRKQYQVHYDFDQAGGKAVIVAVFK